MTRLVETLTDFAGLAGAGLVSYGAWSVYPPAGFITAGLLLMTAAIRLSLSK